MITLAEDLDVKLIMEYNKFVSLQKVSQYQRQSKIYQMKCEYFCNT